MAAVSIGDIDVAFPFSVLEKEHVVNYSTNGLDMAVFFTPGYSLLHWTMTVSARPGQSAQQGYSMQTSTTKS